MYFLSLDDYFFPFPNTSFVVIGALNCQMNNGIKVFYPAIPEFSLYSLDFLRLMIMWI